MAPDEPNTLRVMRHWSAEGDSEITVARKRDRRQTNNSEQHSSPRRPQTSRPTISSSTAVQLGKQADDVWASPLALWRLREVIGRRDWTVWTSFLWGCVAAAGLGYINCTHSARDSAGIIYTFCRPRAPNGKGQVACPGETGSWSTWRCQLSLAGWFGLVLGRDPPQTDRAGEEQKHRLEQLQGRATAVPASWCHGDDGV